MRIKKNHAGRFIVKLNILIYVHLSNDDSGYNYNYALRGERANFTLVIVTLKMCLYNTFSMKSR